MKQILLIITLFIGLGNVNAQDATNDATWEETIDFLSLQLPLFDHQVTMRTNGCSIEKYYFAKHYIKGNIFFQEWIIENTKYFASLDLNLIKKTKLNNYEPGIRIYATGQFVNKPDSNKSDAISLDLISFASQDGCKETQPRSQLYNNSDHEVQRLYKAFQHLVYLAGKKRKKSKF